MSIGSMLSQVSRKGIAARCWLSERSLELESARDAPPQASAFGLSLLLRCA